MKKTAASVLVAVCTLTAHGQLFSPEAVGGAFWGSLLGGVAGGDRGHGFSGRGAALGAGIGLLAGAVVGEARRRDYPVGEPVYYVPQPYAQPGYGYVYPSGPATAYAGPSRPNYAVSGTMLGALGGGLIGASERKGWEGAGIGAAAGLVAGTVAEVAAQKREQRWAAAPAAPPPPVGQTAFPPPVPAPALAPSGSGPVPVCQIPDAPRVPDAPTF